jgi:hypothetical protein
MKKSKFTEAQIAFALKQAETGVSVEEMYCSVLFCFNHLREHGDSPDPEFINDGLF